MRAKVRLLGRRTHARQSMHAANVPKGNCIVWQPIQQAAHVASRDRARLPPPQAASCDRVCLKVKQRVAVDAAAADLPHSERRHRRVSRLRQEHNWVDVGRVPLRAADEEAVVVVAIDEHVELGAEKRLGKLLAHALLQHHDLVTAALSQLWRHLLLHLRRRRAILLAVDKRAHALPPPLLDKGDELAVCSVRLAGKAADESGAQREARNASAQLAQQGHGVVLGWAVHAKQRHVVDVLKGDVDVLAHLGVVSDLVNKVIRKVARVGVQDAHPAQPLELAELMHQLRQPLPVAPVLPILVGVLRDEVELYDAGLHQLGCLLQECRPRLRAELAAEAGDGAERARVVAALGDAQVGRVSRREAVAVPLWPEPDRRIADLHTRPLHVLVGVGAGDAKRAAQRAAEVSVALEANDQVGLRQVRRQLVRVALCEAARDDDLALLSVLIERGRRQHRLDRLRLGIFHKATRVDNDGVGVLMLLHDVKAGAVQVTQQHLAINDVLRTAERHQRHLLARVAGNCRRWRIRLCRAKRERQPPRSRPRTRGTRCQARRDAANNAAAAASAAAAPALA
mmetsp:Transcript_18391/g.54897  ORF Transcript_18391/g.54897 Transcript_18391/m.54897 type:complete len:568 (+) Transcript_18391:413-2116(+)